MLLSLILLVLLSYSPCLSAQFVHWDDPNHIIHNPLVYQSLTWPALKAIFTQTVNATYIPLTVLSHNIEYHVWGLEPWAVHLDNVLVHIIVTLLLFVLALRIGLSRGAAFWAAVIFGLHPMHVESVAWATERKDVLSGMFYLLALISYWDYLKGKDSHYFLSLCFGLLSILSKPMAVSLPWMLFLMDWLARRPWGKKNIFDKIPFALHIFPITLITVLDLSPRLELVFPDAIMIFIWSVVFYVPKFFWPYPLLPLYIPQEPVVLANPAHLGSVIVFVGLVASVWFLRHRWWTFAVLFYAGTIFFFGRFDFTGINLVADRFMYLPSLGFCIFIGWGLDQMAGNKRWRIPCIIGAFLLTVTLSVMTFKQCHIWQNDQTLWQWTLKHEPRNSLARKKLNVALYSPRREMIDYKNFDAPIKKDPRNPKVYHQRAIALIANGRPELAMKDLNQALSLDPNFTEGYLTRGQLYQARSDDQKAMVDFDKVIALAPRDLGGYFNKAIVLSTTEQYERSLELFAQAIALDPKQEQVYYRRAQLYRQRKQWEEAVADFTRAMELKSDFKESYYERGLCYLAMGQYTSAQKDLAKAVSLDASDAEAYSELGVSFLYQNALDQAEKAFTQAITLDPYHSSYYNNRGLVYLKQNRLDEALADYTRAIETNHEPYHNLITRGDIYLSLGKIPQALDDYTQAVLWSKGDVIALLKRAKINFDLEKFSRSLKDINAVILRTPEDTSAYDIRARIYRKMGRLKQAASDEEKARSLGIDR